MKKFLASLTVTVIGVAGIITAPVYATQFGPTVNITSSSGSEEGPIVINNNRQIAWVVWGGNDYDVKMYDVNAPGIINMSNTDTFVDAWGETLPVDEFHPAINDAGEMTWYSTKLDLIWFYDPALGAPAACDLTDTTACTNPYVLNAGSDKSPGKPSLNENGDVAFTVLVNGEDEEVFVHRKNPTDSGPSLVRISSGSHGALKDGVQINDHGDVVWHGADPGGTNEIWLARYKGDCAGTQSTQALSDCYMTPINISNQAGDDVYPQITSRLSAPNDVGKTYVVWQSFGDGTGGDTIKGIYRYDIATGSKVQVVFGGGIKYVTANDMGEIAWSGSGIWKVNVVYNGATQTYSYAPPAKIANKNAYFTVSMNNNGDLAWETTSNIVYYYSKSDNASTERATSSLNPSISNTGLVFHQQIGYPYNFQIRYQSVSDN